MRRLCLLLIFFFKVPPVGVTAESYMNTIKRLGSFNTLQEFWKYYRVLSDLGFLPKQINLQLFKSGIRPIWEEPYNIKGGKWVCFFYVCCPQLSFADRFCPRYSRKLYFSVVKTSCSCSKRTAVFLSRNC